ncbi:MAG: hypothetical protein AAGA68_26545 [Pseudomonadota bacterium]
MADDLMMTISQLAQIEADDEDEGESGALVTAEKVKLYDQTMTQRRELVVMCLEEPAITKLLGEMTAQEIADNELDPDFIETAWDALEELSGVGVMLEAGGSEEELEEAAGNFEGDLSDE